MSCELYHYLAMCFCKSQQCHLENTNSPHFCAWGNVSVRIIDNNIVSSIPLPSLYVHNIWNISICLPATSSDLPASLCRMSANVQWRAADTGLFTTCSQGQAKGQIAWKPQKSTRDTEWAMPTLCFSDSWNSLRVWPNDSDADRKVF